MANSMALTWNLDHSIAAAGNSIRDYIIASREDNVQTLAIMACESFGNTIAMAQSTVNVIQTRVLPTPDPLPLRFLKGSVGFSNSDSTTQLGRSEAGLRFLGLASALVSSMKPSKAAEAIHSMLKHSATDYTQLPTSRNLEDLLSVIEHRCVAAGFANLLLGWQRKLGTAFPEAPEDPAFIGAFPEVDGLNKLVYAFRESYRVGEENENPVITITMKTKGCTAWVAAFSEWCLGFPPTIFTQDGKVVPGSQRQPVHIIHHPADRQSSPRFFTLTRNHSIAGLESLVHNGEVNVSWRAVSSIEEYGEWLLERIGMNRGDNKRAFEDLIPYALYEVTKWIRFSTYHPYNYKHGIESWKAEFQGLGYLSDNQKLPEELNNLRLHPFPEQHYVASMLGRLTGIRDPQLKQMETGLRITELPFVKLHLESLRKQCHCWGCTHSPDGPYNPCDYNTFMDKISNVLADIIALSLFIYPKNIRIRVPVPHHQDNRHELITTIRSIISNSKASFVSYHHLLNWALDLVGHDVGPELRNNDWVASSSLGQAIWPTIFETEIATKYGFLSLQCHNGLFRYKEETYKLVKTHVDLEDLTVAASQDQDTPAVTKPWNRFPQLDIDWRVHVDERVLKLSLGLRGACEPLAIATISPSGALANLASALMVENCPHSPDATLEEPSKFTTNAHPIDPTVPVRSCEDSSLAVIAVVPVSDCNSLRFMSLACGNYYAPMVIRGAACLECCLRVCWKSSYPILIQ